MKSYVETVKTNTVCRKSHDCSQTKNKDFQIQATIHGVSTGTCSEWRCLFCVASSCPWVHCNTTCCYILSSYGFLCVYIKQFPCKLSETFLGNCLVLEPLNSSSAPPQRSQTETVLFVCFWSGFFTLFSMFYSKPIIVMSINHKLNLLVASSDVIMKCSFYLNSPFISYIWCSHIFVDVGEILSDSTVFGSCMQKLTCSVCYVFKRHIGHSL